MSETFSASDPDAAPGTLTSAAPDDAVSLRKSDANESTSARTTPVIKTASTAASTAAGGKRVRPPAIVVKAPMVLNAITAALLVMVLANIARALLLLGNTPMLKVYENDLNNKQKKPQEVIDLVKAVYTLRRGAIVQALIVALALLMLAYAMRQSRSASGTRWAVLIIFVYTAMPFYVIPTHGLPVGVQVAGVLMGAGSIITLGLIFFAPTAKDYFKECRAVNMPAGAAAKPGGLGGLFRPRPANAGSANGRPANGRPANGRPANGRANGSRPAGGLFGGGLFGGGRAAMNRPATTAPQTVQNRPAAPKAKAKVRADSDAVAKGAELARSRAKASKSRRTGD